jgi:AbrB family looped-hinge helix DNA binding protein
MQRIGFRIRDPRYSRTSFESEVQHSHQSSVASSVSLAEAFHFIKQLSTAVGFGIARFFGQSPMRTPWNTVRSSCKSLGLTSIALIRSAGKGLAPWSRRVCLTESFRLKSTSGNNPASSKGQVVLPKSVRDAHQWRPGTEFIVENTADGVLLRSAKPFPPTRLENVVGCLRYAGKPKTLSQMETAVRAEVKGRRGRGRY